MRRYFSFLIAALLLVPVMGFATSAHDGSEKPWKENVVNGIDAYIQKVQKEWKLEGMTAAFAKDGEVIFSKAYGVKEKGGNEPVDVNTIFQIGSVSKSFTATVMASLVDEGLVKWEDSVKNILPDFKMYDPWVTENMLVSDIMIHRTGLGGQVGTYIPNLGYDREDIYNMLPLIKPAYSFRGSYKYNNITFIIASKIIEKVTGKSWEDNVRERVFEPLGMTASTLNGEGFETCDNRSVAHEYYYKDSVRVNALHGDDEALWWLTVIGPAGSVCSNAVDMIKYAEFHRLNGKVGDKQVVSEDGMKYLHNGRVLTSQSDNRTTLYGNCWFVEQNNRFRRFFHTGTTWGFTTLCFVVPEFNLSGIILVNCEAGEGPRYAIMNRLIDLIMGAKADEFTEQYPDYSAESLKSYLDSNKEREAKEAEKESEEIVAAPKASLLVGTYVKDELFGNAKVTKEKEQLYIEIGKRGFKNKLNHKNGNTYTFWSDGHEFPVNFNMDEIGKKVTGFELEFGYGEEDYLGGWSRE